MRKLQAALMGAFPSNKCPGPGLPPTPQAPLRDSAVPFSLGERKDTARTALQRIPNVPIVTVTCMQSRAAVALQMQ